MKNLFAFVLVLWLATSLSAFALPPFSQPEQTTLRDYVHFVHFEINIKIPFAPGANAQRFNRVLPNGATPTERTGQTSASGSAVVIAPGYAVSAWHVFANKEKALANMPPNAEIIDQQTIMAIGGDDNHKVDIEVVAKDVENDLVLLKGDFKCPCITIAHEKPSLDEIIYNVGFPMFQLTGVQFVTSGTFQGTAPSGLHIVTSVTTSGGSGGGSFHKNPATGEWELFGIVNAVGSMQMGPPQFQIHQQFGWMAMITPSSLIHDLIKDAPTAVNYQMMMTIMNQVP